MYSLVKTFNKPDTHHFDLWKLLMFSSCIVKRKKQGQHKLINNKKSHAKHEKRNETKLIKARQLSRAQKTQVLLNCVDDCTETPPTNLPQARPVLAYVS